MNQLPAIPDWAVLTVIGGSLTGPADTVDANIVQLYSVNGLNPSTVPGALVKLIWSNG